jgi:ABC-type glutathione transport system ATPase component
MSGDGERSSGDPILTIRDLDVQFTTNDGIVHAVRGVDFDIRRGETVAIVGESGSGKSQAMMAVMGLLAANGRATGSARYRGQELIGLPQRDLNKVRGEKITMIFQEPMTSLDPLYRIGRQIAEPLVHHQRISAREARAKVIDLLDLVQIQQPQRRIDAYPHELSGGQRQRVMIAMALSNNPDILIADEPTTALDVTIQAQILELLKGLQARLGMAVFSSPTISASSGALPTGSMSCDPVRSWRRGRLPGYSPPRRMITLGCSSKPNRRGPSHPSRTTRRLCSRRATSPSRFTFPAACFPAAAPS